MTDTPASLSALAISPGGSASVMTRLTASNAATLIRPPRPNFEASASTVTERACAIIARATSTSLTSRARYVRLFHIEVEDADRLDRAHGKHGVDGMKAADLLDGKWSEIFGAIGAILAAYQERRCWRHRGTPSAAMAAELVMTVKPLAWASSSANSSVVVPVSTNMVSPGSNSRMAHRAIARLAISIHQKAGPETSLRCLGS